MDKYSTTISGCDLGDRTSHLRLLDAEGAVLDRTKIASTRRAFHKFFTGLDPSMVVLEVGAHSRWSSALIREFGHHCLVANSPTRTTDLRRHTQERSARFAPRRATTH